MSLDTAFVEVVLALPRAILKLFNDSLGLNTQRRNNVDAARPGQPLRVREVVAGVNFDARFHSSHAGVLPIADSP